MKASAQTTFDCKKLLKQEISTPADPQKQVSNFTEHADCFGLDSVDLRIYGQGPVLGTLLMARATESNKKITFADILTDINKAKKDTGYTSLRNLITAQMTLEKRRFMPGNWEGSLKYLKVIGMPDGDMEAFHKYVIEKQEHHWTYRQLITGYRMKQETTAPAKQK
ncbi:MAG: hypothetical protein ABI113_18430 [Mucilaginibacter sp.]